MVSQHQASVLTLVMLLVATLVLVPSSQRLSLAQSEPSAGNSSEGTSTDLKTYTDPAGFYSFQYPSDWVIDDRNITNGIMDWKVDKL